MLTEPERDRIVSTIKNVEQQTDGEIVVCVVDSSGTYPVARWRAAVFLALLTLAIILIARPSIASWAPLWIGNDLAAIGICIVAGLIGGALAARVDWFKRVFVFESELRREVERAASEAFIAEEIFKTRNRTGILIFVSEFERFFEVVADSGINELVKEERWVSVVEGMIDKHGRDDLNSAIIQGVEKCGEILSTSVPVAMPASNELEDDVRTKEGDYDE